MKSTKKTKIETSYPKKSVTLDGMSLYELCRWASLIDAVELIENKCEEKQLDFETVDLQPLDILKYVDSMTDEIYNNALALK
jgi:hypothetical protein